jgi:uncharacterized membrane protein YjdF
MNLKKSHWYIIAFNVLYLLAFGTYYLSIKNYEFMIYIAVILIIGFIVLATLKKSKLDNFALWGLSIWGLLHMAGGGIKINGSSLYSQHLINIVDKGGQFFILKMDQVIHFYGFAVAAIIVYQLIQSYGLSKKLAIFIAWLGSMGLGALNEVIEFTAFITLANTGVGDIYNTGLDLIFNLFGALAGAFIQSSRSK